MRTLTGFWFLGIPSLIASGFGVYCARFLHPFSAWWDLVEFAFFIVLALVLGLFLAAFPGCVVLGPRCYTRMMKNGGPFGVGDKVQILRGPHKGCVSRVYSKWQGDSIRVELGPKEMETFKDKFLPTDLVRAEYSNQEQAGVPE